MRVSLILLIVCLLGINCWGVEFPYSGDCFILSCSNNFSSFNSPNLEYVPGLPTRYINDLGHEFFVGGWVAGSYWNGGAYGSKNDFFNYYGNSYWDFPSYPYPCHYYSQQIPYASVPEPMTIVLLGISSLFVFGIGMKGRRI